MTQVLIVEDERPIARLIEMSLSRSGYACTVADDGLKAADLLEQLMRNRGAALYGVQVDPYQQLATALVRLDLATGEAQDCPLLDNEQVLGVEGSRFVTIRYVSDEPLDPNADPELYNARMQNATAEFGLLTFPTGEREVLFREPNDRTVYLNGFLGVRDRVLYFEKHNAAGDAGQRWAVQLRPALPRGPVRGQRSL